MQSTATGSHLTFLNINMHVVTYNVCYYLYRTCCMVSSYSSLSSRVVLAPGGGEVMGI